ncbi:hypothetical protein TOPH_08824, partial [Tolypocladium ophioglossoides CBS 100239]
PYYTHGCLRDLVFGPIDKHCPNIHDHGCTHVDRQRFLHLIRDQHAVDRGYAADCNMSLSLSGSRRSLFKTRPSTHGYALVAQGAEEMDVVLLRHENNMYNKMCALQGKRVSVCLSIADLILPCYYDGGVLITSCFSVGMVEKEVVDATATDSRSRISRASFIANWSHAVYYRSW